MTIVKLSPTLALAGVLAGLIFVSPALSSRTPVETVAPPAVPALGDGARRPVRPAERKRPVAFAATDCTKTRRSLWVEGEGWVVRRVAICR